MTPSIVGRQVGARLVRARYIHYDGYPTGVGRNVWRIARRDGPRRALRALTKNHYGWSSIRADQPDITGVLPFPDSPTNSPEQFASYLSPGGLFGNGHFVNVPKYGIAHTDDVIERNGETYQQVRADDIYTWDGGHLEAKAEWMYGIDIKHAAVSVYVIDKFSYPQRPVPELVVVLPIGTAEPDWAVIEQRGVALAHRACTTPQMR